MKKAKASRKGAMSEIVAMHKGTVLSCFIKTNTNCNALLVLFGTKAKKGEPPDVVISIEGGSPVDLFCPSVEGTVIWCKLKSGEERFYDTRTGKHLSEKELKERSAEIHLYQ
ncbi:MAG: hypothetical protein PHV93_00645 [Candidatus Pacebacteria bacterium]|nr:hypothetical protein [Candidatus Paceibacterota bacterium]